MSDATVTQSVAREPQRCGTDNLVTSVQKVQNVNVSSNRKQPPPNVFLYILYVHN